MSADDTTLVRGYTAPERALMELVAAANEVLKAPGWGRDEDSARSEEARSWLAEALDKARSALPGDRCARCGGVGRGPYNRLCPDERYPTGGLMCVCPDCNGLGRRGAR